MAGEAPAGGALQAGGAEGVKAQLGSAAVDVVGDLLQGLKVCDIGDLIAGLLQPTSATQNSTIASIGGRAGPNYSPTPPADHDKSP